MSRKNNESDVDDRNESDDPNESDLANKSDETDHEDMYTIRPPLEEKFNAAKVKDVVESIVLEELDGKRYNSFVPEEMNGHLCQLINKKLREFPYQRYKYVIELLLAEQKGQGMEFLSRCLWDQDTDNQATVFVFTQQLILGTVIHYAANEMVLISPILHIRRNGWLEAFNISKIWLGKCIDVGGDYFEHS